MRRGGLTGVKRDLSNEGCPPNTAVALEEVVLLQHGSR